MYEYINYKPKVNRTKMLIGLTVSYLFSILIALLIGAKVLARINKK